MALPKLPKIAPEFRLHWIGRLQTNKVKGIIDHVCMLHTLDRLALAQEVERRAAEHGRVLPALVQINIAREPQKAACRRRMRWVSFGRCAIFPISTSKG